jgi:hypothetical protein
MRKQDLASSLTVQAQLRAKAALRISKKEFFLRL